MYTLLLSTALTEYFPSQPVQLQVLASSNTLPDGEVVDLIVTAVDGMWGGPDDTTNNAQTLHDWVMPWEEGPASITIKATWSDLEFRFDTHTVTVSGI